jgi:hypothetical protein
MELVKEKYKLFFHNVKKNNIKVWQLYLFGNKKALPSNREGGRSVSNKQ